MTSGCAVSARGELHVFVGGDPPDPHAKLATGVRRGGG
jgi:hypothetical protein